MYWLKQFLINIKTNFGKFEKGTVNIECQFVVNICGVLSPYVHI